MAWTHRTPKSNNGSGTNCVVTRPDSVASGDVVHVWITHGNEGATVSPPDGTWTEKINVQDFSTGYRFHCFTKTAGGSEPGTYTFTLSSAETFAWVSGAHAGGSGTVTTGGGTTRAAGATSYQTFPVTPAGNGALVIAGIGIDSNEQHSPFSADSSPAATMVGSDIEIGAFIHAGVQRYEQATAAALTLDFGLTTAANVDVAVGSIALEAAVGGATQKVQPVADGAVDGWTPSAGTDLFAVLDEATENAADYVQSVSSPDGKKFRVKLGVINTPPGGTRTIHLNPFKTAAAGETHTGLVRIYEGGGTTFGAGTLVQSFNLGALDDVNNTIDLTVTNAITAYWDLWLEYEVDVT